MRKQILFSSPFSRIFSRVDCFFFPPGLYNRYCFSHSDFAAFVVVYVLFYLQKQREREIRFVCICRRDCEWNLTFAVKPVYSREFSKLYCVCVCARVIYNKTWKSSFGSCIKVYSPSLRQSVIFLNSHVYLILVVVRKVIFSFSILIRRDEGCCIFHLTYFKKNCF